MIVILSFNFESLFYRPDRDIIFYVQSNHKSLTRVCITNIINEKRNRVVVCEYDKIFYSGLKAIFSVIKNYWNHKH